MTQLTQNPKNKSVFFSEILEQLQALGISPEELSKQFASLDLSLDEVLKKTASVGVSGVLLAMIISNFGTLPLVKTLATSLTGPMFIIGDSLVGYGIEVVIVNIYIERLKTDSLEELFEEIDILPVTDTLRSKVKDRLKNEFKPRTERKITIVQD